MAISSIISVALFRGHSFGEQTPRVVCSVPNVFPLPRLRPFDTAQGDPEFIEGFGGQALPATHTPGRSV